MIHLLPGCKRASGHDSTGACRHDTGRCAQSFGASEELLPFLEALPRLRSVLLQGQQATDGTLEVLGRMKDLEGIYLPDAQVTDR